MNDISPQAEPPQLPGADVPSPPPDASASASRKKKARRRLIILAAGVVAAGIAVWCFERSFSLPLQNLASLGSSSTSTVSDQSSTAPIFSAPSSSLQQASKVPPKKTNTLTGAGVIEQTNDARAANGDLPPLAENATLDAIATLRIDDMFDLQYFAHVGPQGESALTVASSVGYAHLALGENLALGTYAGDEGVVDAWMASPGHRANILDAHYTQIGVAVRKGTFEGEETWVAVQIFGRPASDCPTPDTDLKKNIDLSESEIASTSVELQSQKAFIDAMSPQSGPAYNGQVEDYNNLAAQYNTLVAETKTAVAEYDAEVNGFNACLAE